MKRRMLVVALSAALALAVAMPMAFGQAAEQQEDSTASAQTGELTAAWWQWSLSKPVPLNPMIGEYRGGPQCNGQPVSDTPGDQEWWFLASPFYQGTVERTCTIPAGRWLFFPVVNYVFIITEPNQSEEIARRVANEDIDSVLTDPELSMSVRVDREEVLRRADSPLFTAEIPEDNVVDSPTFDLPAGSYQAVSDGLWATVAPLSKGKHTIHFELSAPNLGEQGFIQDTTYHLTVKRAKPAS